MAEEYKDGGRHGDVSIERWYYYAEGKVVVMRKDTGEVIAVRELYDNERQTGLGFPGNDPDGLRRPGILGPYSRFHPIIGEVGVVAHLPTPGPVPPSRPGVPR